MTTEHEPGDSREGLTSIVEKLEKTVAREFGREPSVLLTLVVALAFLALSPLLVTFWNPDQAKDWSELVKNVIESLAVLGVVCAAVKWVAERKDRATDILLKLEEKFDQPVVRQGRACLEDKDRLGKLEKWLEYYVDKASNDNAKPLPAEPAPPVRAQRSAVLAEIVGPLIVAPSGDAGLAAAAEAAEPITDIDAFDALLRFYVVLCGVREARQVSDASLLACYRYWLALYFVEKREPVRNYVDQFYPTLRKWLAEYQPETRHHHFFRPKDFWDKEKLIATLPCPRS